MESVESPLVMMTVASFGMTSVDVRSQAVGPRLSWSGLGFFGVWAVFFGLAVVLDGRIVFFAVGPSFGMVGVAMK